MPLLDHFGILAPYYDRVIRLRNAQQMIDILALPAQGALLDAGGGTGRVTQALNGLASPLIVTDLSETMLRQAALKGGLHTVCSPTEGLPVAAGTFERIMIVDALHHVYDARKTCHELWRVLKPGGRLVIEEPDIRTFAVKLVALGEKLALMRSHFIAPPEIAGYFSFPGADVSTRLDGFNAWVVVDKSASALA